jgi:hypothetical protein
MAMVTRNMTPIYSDKNREQTGHCVSQCSRVFTTE